MAFKNLVEAVDDKLASIASILVSLEQGSGSVELRDLAQHLIDAMGLFQRNPGIDAAADDLYAAAAALVADRMVGSQPLVRKIRLFKDAHLRFRSRLLAAAERVGPYEHLVVQVPSVREAA
jgi:hypothetical protein